MVLINEISLSSMKNSLYAQFMADTDNQILRVTPAALKITRLYADFTAGRAAFDNAYVVQKKDDRTATLAEIDKQRNESYRCINGHAKADLLSFNAERREKAQILLNRMNAYGQIHRLPNNEKSAAITDLVNVVQETPYAEIVEELGYKDEFDGLNAINNQFINLSRTRTESKKSQNMATADARNMLDPAYRNIIQVVNSQISINNMMDPAEPEEDEPIVQSAASDPLEDFALSMNAIISEYKKKMNQSGSNSNKDEQPDKPADEDEPTIQ